MTPDPERWKIGDRRLHGQPRGWFPGPWWLVGLEEQSATREESADKSDEVEEEDDGSQSAGDVQSE
jgi:hypothetical protein